jgi:drug/metabolite transporter (DMT)-like permease
MNNHTPANWNKWIWLGLGCALFGVLMGVRGGFHSVVVRSVIAGCGAALFALFLEEPRF